LNLILFEKHEISAPLSLDDPRAVHLKSVLRRNKNELFDAGIVNGPRGKGRIIKESTGSLMIEFDFSSAPATDSLYPVILAVGLPRPQTARKILREVTSLGASRIYFFGTDRGEESYKKSSLWTSGEVRKHLIHGAEQAFCTLLPRVEVFSSLCACIEALPPGDRVALDNYEGVMSLASCTYSSEWTGILVGPEKGWSPGERDLLRRKNCILVHCGSRVLRTETASVAGMTLILARRGFI
jgi:16S rRNA (uracil1498-N3)-methyltransferase